MDGALISVWVALRSYRAWSAAAVTSDPIEMSSRRDAVMRSSFKSIHAESTS
jgi:hypothetical protein